MNLQANCSTPLLLSVLPVFDQYLAIYDFLACRGMSFIPRILPEVAGSLLGY